MKANRKLIAIAVASLGLAVASAETHAAGPLLGTGAMAIGSSAENTAVIEPAAVVVRRGVAVRAPVARRAVVGAPVVRRAVVGAPVARRAVRRY